MSSHGLELVHECNLDSPIDEPDAEYTEDLHPHDCGGSVALDEGSIVPRAFIPPAWTDVQNIGLHRRSDFADIRHAY